MKFAFLALLICSCSSLLAQEDTCQNYVSAGVGFPNLPRYFFNFLSNKDNYKLQGTGPFHLKYENRVTPWLGLGISINHVTYKINYSEVALDTSNGMIINNKIEISNNNTTFNFRANIHFIKPQKNPRIDVYLGIGIGIKTGKLHILSQYPEYAPSLNLPSLNKLGLESTFGFRYFIDTNVGVYMELGFAKSLVQAGVVTRF